MEKIAIATDSNSGITQAGAKELGSGSCRCLFISTGSCIMRILR